MRNRMHVCIGKTGRWERQIDSACVCTTEFGRFPIGLRNLPVGRLLESAFLMDFGPKDVDRVE